MNCFKNRQFWIALAGLAVFVCLPTMCRAQTGTIAVQGSVSEVVALSASSNFAVPNVRITGAADRKSLTLELTGSGAGEQTFRLPVLIRSNSGYSISSLVRSESVSAVTLDALDARATGRFVASEAAGSLVSIVPGNSIRLDLSARASIFRGSRISLAGTLDSPENAVEVTLLVTVSPAAKANVWRLQIMLSAAAGQRF